MHIIIDSHRDTAFYETPFDHIDSASGRREDHIYNFEGLIVL